MIKKERNVMNELLLIEFIIVSRAKGRYVYFNVDTYTGC